ncbi:alpha/beta fold hydrolase [Nocardia sp. NPDC058658]|uniref:alpha/beta fold hydrolase n=1 Tax=Nocardia sp. NPDC058658 TaxID=3346580 RepID=UPI003651AF0A
MSHTPLIVLIHGAWAASWVWNPIIGTLTDAGCATLAVDLPDVDPDQTTELDSNVDHVVAQIADFAGPIILVGHSGGGLTATAVAEHIPERITGIVYVAGMMLPSGMSFEELRSEIPGMPTPLGIEVFLEPAGAVPGSVVPADAAVAVFFHRAPPHHAVAAARRLRPQPDAGRMMTPHWTPERYGVIPRLYIEAVHDRTIPLALQRHMQLRTPGARVVTLDSDHAPQMSAPGELAKALLDFTA